MVGLSFRSIVVQQPEDELTDRPGQATIVEGVANQPALDLEGPSADDVGACRDGTRQGGV